MKLAAVSCLDVIDCLSQYVCSGELLCFLLVGSNLSFSLDLGWKPMNKIASVCVCVCVCVCVSASTLHLFSKWGRCPSAHSR